MKIFESAYRILYTVEFTDEWQTPLSEYAALLADLNPYPAE